MLPPLAQKILKDAAGQAAKLKPESVERARVMEEAIDKVRAMFPNLFKKES